MTSNSTVVSIPVTTSTSTSTPSFFFPSISPPSSSPPSSPTTISTPTSTPVQAQSSSSLTPSPVTTSTSSVPSAAASTPNIVTTSQSIVTVTDSNNNETPSTKLITFTSTPPSVALASESRSSPQTESSSSTSVPGPLASQSSSPSSTGSVGLSPGGKIAVAVVVPVVAVALIVLAALFFWRKRKQRKDAEELRRKEVEEYGFNPNNDPTLPAVGGASSNGDEPSDMRETDGAGYRGWGTTSTARKASTTLSSGNGQIGMARSDSGSNPGGYSAGSPTGGTDVQSGDPLVGSHTNARPGTADSETIGALGSAPAALGNRQDRDIHRGPSNASSAYSGAHRSDTSDSGVPGNTSGQQYYNEGLYYDEGMPQHGPYNDGAYSGGQPVIRDVQARRNTRIENPTIFPQQGNAGIAQNF
ncbi:hypothetical protein MMC07_000302 [Pseudocyphellaria aurata]|nr:hypothetical protein [Pseudocyphellaria aurata]